MQHSKSTQRKLIQFFVLEVTARTAANILGIQANSAMLFYRKIRQVIAYYLELQADEVFDGSVELDESYFGRQRKGKRGRGATGKVAVFGILKRNGKAFTIAVENTKKDTLLPVIKRKIMPDRIVYTGCYKSYDVLDVSEFTHHRINHSQSVADRQNHINDIENFWNQAKRVLRKYNGIDRQSFPLFLKEYEFRFNLRYTKRTVKNSVNLMWYLGLVYVNS